MDTNKEDFDISRLKRFLWDSPNRIHNLIVTTLSILTLGIVVTIGFAMAQPKGFVQSFSETFSNIMGPVVGGVAAVFALLAFYVQYKANEDIRLNFQESKISDRLDKLISIYNSLISELNHVDGIKGIECLHLWASEYVTIECILLSYFHTPDCLVQNNAPSRQYYKIINEVALRMLLDPFHFKIGDVLEGYYSDDYIVKTHADLNAIMKQIKKRWAEAMMPDTIFVGEVQITLLSDKGREFDITYSYTFFQAPNSSLEQLLKLLVSVEDTIKEYNSLSANKGVSDNMLLESLMPVYFFDVYKSYRSSRYRYGLPKMHPFTGLVSR